MASECQFGIGYTQLLIERYWVNDECLTCIDYGTQYPKAPLPADCQTAITVGEWNIIFWILVALSVIFGVIIILYIVKRCRK
jgi:hypothetical protein